MLLNVTEVKPTKSGKSVVVKAGGKDYFAKTDAGIQAGMSIDAETEDSEYNGKTLVWIQKWRAVSKPNGGAPASNGAMPPVWANFVSNQVAHAIAAGRIDDPEQIKVWAAAAKQAFMELMG